MDAAVLRAGPLLQGLSSEQRERIASMAVRRELAGGVVAVAPVLDTGAMKLETSCCWQSRSTPATTAVPGSQA